MSLFTFLTTFLRLIKFLSWYSVPFSIPDLVLYNLFHIIYINLGVNYIKVAKLIIFIINCEL